jgi:uridine kinase
MYIIGITGQSCSGKTTLSRRLLEALGEENCLLVSLDNYYKELTQEQYKVLHNDEAVINFDTPESINFDLLKRNLIDLKQNRTCLLPNFDLGSCVITSWTEHQPNKYKYIILEGLFIFSDPEILDMCNLKVWVETSDYVCALRRFIKFTCNIKGYTPEYVYNQCLKYVIPGQEKYIKPIKKYCDFLINGEKEDLNSIEMFVSYISEK